MGAEDVARQELNVFRMELLGAKVVAGHLLRDSILSFPYTHRNHYPAVQAGSKTLKDAINEAMRDWVTNIDTTHYLIGKTPTFTAFCLRMCV